MAAHPKRQIGLMRKPLKKLLLGGIRRARPDHFAGDIFLRQRTSQQDGAEQQLTGAVRLSPMLSPEAQQNDPSLLDYLHATLSRLAHLDELHPAGDGSGELAEVVLDLLVGRELVVCARFQSITDCGVGAAGCVEGGVTTATTSAAANSTWLLTRSNQLPTAEIRM